MQAGYEMATSVNLPEVCMDMIADYLMCREDFNSAEIKDVKCQRSAKEDYGDKAIGQVQVKRDGDLCYISARITSKHKIPNKSYNVNVIINEKECSIVTSECLDCTTSRVDCKHSIAMIFWLYRRRMDSSITKVECYWEDTSERAFTLEDIFGLPAKPPHEDDVGDDFLQEVIALGRANNAEGMLYLPRPNDILNQTSLHRLKVDHHYNSQILTLDSFMQFVRDNLTSNECLRLEEETRDKSKSHLRDEVRYGRITDSIAYEASQCETPVDSLVNRILCGTIYLEPEPDKQKELLECVLRKIEIIKKIKTDPCGMFLDEKYPIFCASPDAVTNTHCIEVKCPPEGSSLKYSLKDEVQFQLQMFLSKRKKGFFCIASPTFKKDGQVNIIETDLDENYCTIMMNRAQSFWDKHIYPKLFQ